MAAPETANVVLAAWDRIRRRSPRRVVVIEAATGRRWTVAQLDERARQHATTLRTLSSAWRDEWVVLALPNGADWLAWFLALVRVGAVPVPLDPGEPAAAQHDVATRIGARWLLAGESPQPVAGTAAWRRRSGGFLVKLTSGSTGVPRPLLFTADEMVADARQVTRGMRIRSSDMSHAVIPFGHSYGLGNLVLPLLVQGSGIVVGSAPLPHVLAGEIERWRPTVFPTVPAVLRALAAAEVPATALRSLRLVVSAGARLAPEIAAAFATRFGRRVHNFYGSSETGGIAFDPTGRAALTGEIVGRPLPDVQVSIRAGRVLVASAAVFTQGNRRRSGAHGAHLLADRAALTATGEIALRGRTSRSVKVGGRRVSLGDVEAALLRIPGVDAAFVCAVERDETLLVAAVQTARSAPALQEDLRAQLAPWKRPKRLIVLPRFPLTARGKTDTKALRQRLGAGPAP